MEFSEHQLAEMLQEVVDAGHVIEGSREHGIAKLVLDKGEAALSDAQRAIYQIHVLPYLKAIAHKHDKEDRVSRWPD
ncbi:hypothetical protein D3C87_1394890 [compost metagenome]